ncbi:MAG: hypothetical protein KAT94_01105 [Candidatus Aenigmarchaeota archaeon]|nr:hypothetical protein [Candidatus Aenigmarchaeota archaeon]
MSPSKITMDFIPNEEFEFEGQVINTGDGTLEFDIYADAELKDFITLLTPDYLLLGPYQSSVFRFRIKLPDKFDRPGEHIGIIWAATRVESEEGIAIARIKVGMKIVVRVPYPGKYAEIKLDIENANVNDTVLFEITATNLGKENITSARGEIKILNMENETVVVLQTEGKPIETTKIETFRATWFSDVEPGLYKVEATLFYDGENTSLEMAFNLGAPLIEIVNVSAESMVNGTIGKILTKIHSYWNQEIEDVYVELSVRDKNGKIIGEDKSKNVNVRAFSSPTITNYWDTTRGVPLGEYNATVVLRYLDRNDTAEFEIEVVEKTGMFGLPESLGNFVLIIIIVVVVIAVFVAVFLVFYTKKRKKSKQKRLV